MQNVGSSSQTGSLSVSKGAIPFSARMTALFLIHLTDLLNTILDACVNLEFLERTDNCSPTPKMGLRLRPAHLTYFQYLLYSLSFYKNSFILIFECLKILFYAVFFALSVSAFMAQTVLFNYLYGLKILILLVVYVFISFFDTFFYL